MTGSSIGDELSCTPGRKAQVQVEYENYGLFTVERDQFIYLSKLFYHKCTTYSCINCYINCVEFFKAEFAWLFVEGIV